MLSDTERAALERVEAALGGHASLAFGYSANDLRTITSALRRLSGVGVTDAMVRRACDAFEAGPQDFEDSMRAALEQALSDPENQPSQWGTIPLAMIPAEIPIPDPSLNTWDDEDWTDYGRALGWNEYRDKLLAAWEAP